MILPMTLPMNHAGRSIIPLAILYVIAENETGYCTVLNRPIAGEL
jgi:hypothetical protein